MFDLSKSTVAGGSTVVRAALALLILVAGAASPGAQQVVNDHRVTASPVNPPYPTSLANPGGTVDSSPLPPDAPSARGPELIGPWTIVQSPASAVSIVDGGNSWNWLNVFNVPVTLNEAFTGFSVIADGFANGDEGTTVEMTFSPEVENHAGTDLVLFDARFSTNSYAVSTDFDGFVTEYELPGSAFSFTGAGRVYFYDGGGPFFAMVMAAPIDLSDLGVPDGASVSAVRVIARSGQVDLLGLGVSGSCLAFNFTTEDDFVTPLVNGQHIDTEFGSVVTITSSGANAGPAIFDSTVNGPNVQSQDLDLLVGRGNILVLQAENFPPDGNDVFPHPNDDDDGGTLTFTFGATRAGSLRLIDIDASDETSTVALIDSVGRQRVYTVPSNWTGDITLAQPGQGVLDLTTLAPQPGFGSTATAAEDADFAPTEVVQIDVRLEGSGGVDDLVLCTTGEGVPRASLLPRNGSGLNGVTLASSNLPVIGGTWLASLDCQGFGSGTAILSISRRAIDGELTPFGERLVGGSLLHRTICSFSGVASQFSWSVPNDAALMGMEVHAQGLCRSATITVGSKFSGPRGGLSNALDLTLGF